MPMPQKPDPEKLCQACGALLRRKRMNGRLEDRTVFLKRLYCDQKCMGKAHMRPDPTRSAYLKRIAHLKKKNCEICRASDKRLTLHHKDRNWRNGDPSNIQTLCSSCHTSLHHANAEIVPRAKERPCAFCQRPIWGRSVCNTCRTQIRRNGKPSPRTTKRRSSSRRGLLHER